jgi:hypothetical protein
MNQRKLFTNFFASLLFIVLLLGGCPMESEDDENKRKEADINFSDGRGELELEARDGEPRFFSLSTGREITAQADIESQAWDIAFYATRIIWTNSGVSAGDNFSGGKGGVWHTNQTDFDAVAGREAAVTGDPVYAPYHEDVRRYAHGMAGSGMRLERNMNVMTFLGFDNESEEGAGKTAEKPFTVYYNYDKKAFYANTFDAKGMMTMPPRFYVTNQVYIIRHGDGEHYSKFQVTKFIRNYTADLDTYAVRWENLD